MTIVTIMLMVMVPMTMMMSVLESGECSAMHGWCHEP